MSDAFPAASFWRRLGGLIYDYLLAFAVFALAHFAGFLLLAVINAYQPALSAGYPDLASFISDSLLYKLYLLLVVTLFFLWFWTHGGQTLGMRAWRLKIQNPDGSRLRWRQAVLRALVGFGGFATLTMLLSPSRRSIQDSLAGTEVVVLSKEANQLKNWQGL